MILDDANAPSASVEDDEVLEKDRCALGPASHSADSLPNTNDAAFNVFCARHAGIGTQVSIANFSLYSSRKSNSPSRSVIAKRYRHATRGH